MHAVAVSARAVRKLQAALKPRPRPRLPTPVDDLDLESGRISAFANYYHYSHAGLTDTLGGVSKSSPSSTHLPETLQTWSTQGSVEGLPLSVAYRSCLWYTTGRCQQSSHVYYCVFSFALWATGTRTIAVRLDCWPDRSTDAISCR